MFILLLVIFPALVDAASIRGDCDDLNIPRNVFQKLSCTANCEVEFSCKDAGYEYNGTTIRTCLENGSWSGVAGTCNEVQCPPLRAPLNGRISPGDRHYLSKATVHCDDGYIFSKPNFITRKCQSNKTWDGEEGICEAVRCPLLPEPQNGQIQYKGRSYLSNATVQCHEGYNYSRRDHIIRQCRGDNTWSGEQGTCDRVFCSSIPGVKNGILSSHGGRYQDTVLLQCHSGHILDGPSTVMCRSDGTWSAKMGQCLKPRKTIENWRIVLPSVLVPVLLLCLIGFGLYLWRCYQQPVESEPSNISMETQIVDHLERDIETARLLEPEMFHCSFTLKEDFTAEYSEIGSPEYNSFKSVIANAVKSAIQFMFENTSDVKVEVMTLCQKNKTAFINVETRGITAEDMESALPMSNIVSNRTGHEASYHIMKDSITHRERPIHNIIADICLKMHKPDKPLDKRIDIEKQYVKLKLQTSKTLGAMRRAALERPDLYQKGLESADGNEIEEEDVIKGGEFEKYILIRGRAGIGKSTLVQRLLWKWANGEWATKFKVLFLLNLRYLMTIDTPMTLPYLLSLYSVYNTGNADVIIGAEWLERNQGKIGFILDGVDEIQNFINKWKLSDPISANTNKAKPLDWCFALMKRDYLQRSTVILSSRPFADLTVIGNTLRTMGLSTNFCIVELMGLTRERVEEFVEKNAHKERIEYIKQTLNNNLLLMSVCSITFYCAALCHVLGEDDEMLPKLTTYTQITAYIMQAYIMRSMKIQGKAPQKKLRKSLNQPLAVLSRLACDGLLNQGPGGLPRLIFDQKDFDKLNVGAAEVAELRKSGLLMESDISNSQQPDSTQVLRQFVHLSIQELLAMAGLLKSDPQRLKETLQTLTRSGQFGMALLFLYGLAFNEDNDILKSVSTALTGSFEEKQGIRSVLLDSSNIYVCDSLQALQIAHESQSSDVAKMIGDKMFQEEISIKGTKLTVIDIIAMQFLLKHYQSPHTLKLIYVDIDKILLQEIVQLLEASANIQCLELTDRNIDNDCLKDILEVINTQHSLRSFLLISPMVSDVGVGAVASSLETNHTLKTLGMTCELTNDGLETIGDALRRNKALTELFLAANPYVKKGDSSMKNLSEALKGNTSLEKLSLQSDGINDEGIKQLGEAVSINKTLKQLRILSGTLTDVGVKYIAAALRVNESLKELCLWGFRIGQEGTDALLDGLRHNKRVSLSIWKPCCSDETFVHVKNHVQIKCE